VHPKSRSALRAAAADAAVDQLFSDN
jgi:hypothetical protein